jgi:ATP-binding cassette subfamily B protein
MAILNLSGSMIVLLSIMAAIFYINTLIALIVFGGFGILYGAVILITKKMVLKNSQRMSRESSRAIKVMQEGLGGIRDILISSTQEVFYELFRQADTRFRRSEGSISIIGAGPRYLMEAIGIVLILFVAYRLTISNEVSFAIPILGALALSAQRALPVLQLCYSSFVNIKGNAASLNMTLDLLDQKMPIGANLYTYNKIDFEKEIELRGISFRYSDSLPFTLDNIQLKIKKGEKLGFIGKTGSGKSTLLDVIMGLLAASNGQICVDGIEITAANLKAWQANIAHVPQFVYLADASIAENIAFGMPKNEIDMSLVKIAAQKAQISNVIDSWSGGYLTEIGERGVRLSGGQRQRIGIARAFYKKAKVLVFDEATSALDGETENSVMQSIDTIGDGITVLIIAHRVSTLKNCHRIVEVKEGQIYQINNIKSNKI